MKKTLISLVCILMCNYIYAQIMKDSTVQIVAYWELGEKYKYKHESYEYNVEGNDTIWGDWAEELFTMEVVDSTAKGYIIEYRCLEEKHDMQDKEEQAILEAIMKKYKDIPFRIATDEYGRFQDLANWHQIQVAVDSMAADLSTGLKNYIKKDLEKENSDSIPTEGLQQLEIMINHICQSLKNKEMVLAGMDYITSPLYFHGSRLELDKEYTGEEDFVSPWIPTDIVKGDVSFNIHKVDYETSWGTFHRTHRYDAGQLGTSFLKYLTQVLPENEVSQITPDQIPFLMVESFLDLDVHLNTGWPGATLFKKTVQVGNKQKINVWNLELILDK